MGNNGRKDAMRARTRVCMCHEPMNVRHETSKKQLQIQLLARAALHSSTIVGKVNTFNVFFSLHFACVRAI